MDRDATQSNDRPIQQQTHARHVRLPGFITDTEIGLGDVIKKASRRAGVQPCGGCERRAAALNRWVVFSPRSSGK